MITCEADVERKMTPRFRGLIDQLTVDLATWDLCCDHGIVGVSALLYGKTNRVTFVDRQRHLLDQLTMSIDNLPFIKQLCDSVCADILVMPLLQKPVNYVVAGVGTNLILQFLTRFQVGQGHRVICHTHQNPDRFERLVMDKGIIWVQKIPVMEKYVPNYIWVFQF